MGTSIRYALMRLPNYKLRVIQYDGFEIVARHSNGLEEDRKTTLSNDCYSSKCYLTSSTAWFAVNMAP